MKKIVSILLVLTLLVNIFGFGFMNIRAGAEVLTAIGLGIIGLVSGYIGTGLGGLLADSTDDYINRLSNAQRELIDAINYNGIKNGELIQISGNETNGYYFIPVSGLSGEKQKFAEFMCNKFNNSDNINTIIEDYRCAYNEYLSHDPDMEFYYQISADQYAEFKSECINAFNEYMALNDYIEGAQKLAETGDFPTYDFDFVGPLDPLTHITIPGSEKIVSTNIDGFVHSVPWTIERSDGLYYSAWTSYPFGDSYAGVTSLSQLKDNGCYLIYCCGASGSDLIGTYVIYNNELYYKVSSYGTGSAINISQRLQDAEISSYRSATGKKLNEQGCTTLVGLKGGAYYRVKGNNSGGDRPTIDVTTDDMTETTADKNLLFPLSDEEDTIHNAIAAGLLPQDFMLKLNELGNIISANNIPIEQLTSLLENLKKGQLKFDDFEQYLQYISALLSAGNIDRQTSAKILNNIRALQEQTNNNIGVINTAISGLKELDQERNETLARIDANTATIAEAITTGAIISAGTDFDVRTPNIITDKFPFSLPFDVYHVFNLLSAEPRAPRWEIPIEMNGVFDYSIEVDLSEYDWIANIVRWLLYAVFIVGLILATNKLIGRG